MAALSRQPKIEVLEVTENTIHFVLSKTHVSFANALRRVMIAEVPAFAIDLVQMEENNTMLHDEFIAHRLGMVPLRYTGTDLMTKFKFPRDCTGPSTEDGLNPECSVAIDLSVVNRSQDQPLNVTSMDLVSHHPDVTPMHYASREEAEMCADHDRGIVLVKLAPGESIKARCIATLGTAKEHAKWCSCAVATFHYEYNVELDHELMESLGEEKCKEFVNRTQPGVFKWNEERKQVVVVDTRLCRNWLEVIRVAKSLTEAEAPLFITVKQVPERYLFYVETTGSHRPEDIVSEALLSLKRKLGTIRLRCDAMKMEMEEDSKEMEEGDSARRARWSGATAAESHMLNNKDVRGGE